MIHQAPAPTEAATAGNSPTITAATEAVPGSAVEAQSTTRKAFVEYFKHRGKEYKIYKRRLSKDAPWYCHYAFEGQRHQVNAKTNEMANAVVFFKRHIDAAWSGRLRELEDQKEAAPAKTKFATWGEFVLGVEQAALDLDPQTRRQYINCLRNVVRRVKGPEVDVDGLSCEGMDAEFVRRFFENALRSAQRENAQADENRVKRTANSILNQAKALLRPKVIASLRRNGYVNAAGQRVALVLPEFALERVWKEERFEGVNKLEWNPPSDALTRKTLHAWAKVKDRNHFLALGLELAFGLRKAEISQATWEWLTVLEGQPFIDGAANVKNGRGHVQVRALDPFWTVLRRRIAREGWQGKPNEFMLSGTMTERCESVFRTIGAWMRELGWKTQKTNHAWRAYVGSQVAMRYGIYSAFVWLRHSSVTVTEQHYSHFIAKHKIDSKRKVLRRWARAPRNVLALRAA